MSAGSGWIPETYLGLVLGFAILLLDPLLELLLARGLGARVTNVEWGFGPVLRRTPGREHVTEIRMLPIRFQARYLPRREHYARDKRLLISSGLVSPLLLGALVAVFVPGWTTVATLAFVFVCVLIRALAKEKYTRRRVIMRVVRRTTPSLDAELSEPRFPVFAHTYHAVFYGDWATAAALLPAVHANRWPLDGSKLIVEALHVARGEYEEAVSVAMDFDPSKHMLADLETTHLALLMAEARPETTEQAVMLAGAFLRRQTHVASSEGFAAMLALYRLETGNLPNARGCMERFLASVSTPLEIADALCTRARIEAAAGSVDRAARTLREAHTFAPWYARVAIVRERLGIEAVEGLGAAGPLDAAQTIDPASRDPHRDPWAAPRR
ncbi:hypothetical protein KDK95_13820 [Actinospica sp. MGRD01-02]|uniref:Uncharacterized protein n=1 Tax=Actinospica acidithermotolerans TaxID=2828514 RepID=A0A941E9C4_9ACTN|nr:hypothetical protein [Actinospica acidithermotolerans]MBR7827391.1 hypothetical protein [Actinospica acidithermotolerans]